MSNPKVKYLIVVGLVGQSILACGKNQRKKPMQKTDDFIGSIYNCRPPHQEACEASRHRIHDLLEARDAALTQNDRPQVARISLQLNQEEEKLRLIASGRGSAESLRRLDSKYKTLSGILEQELSLRRYPSAGAEGVLLPLPSVIYSTKEAQAVSQVMNTFGELYIRESGRDGSGLPVWNELKVDRPWSGYWYPLGQDSLFRGENSPLAKLDQLAAIRGRSVQSAAVEKVKASFAQDGWEGHCAAWAMASILSKEPQQAQVMDGITFSVHDQKALLTKIFEIFPHRVFGIRYDGDDQTDGTLQDIRPEAFHRIFLKQLGQEKKAFIIDDSSGIEIWSKPVYRMRWTVQPDTEKPFAYIVKAQPWLIKHRTDESDQLTSDQDRSSPEWVYRLYVNPDDKKNDQYRVIAGEWVGASREHHPDTVTIPDFSQKPKSSNEEINKALDLVKSIVELSE